MGGKVTSLPAQRRKANHSLEYSFNLSLLQDYKTRSVRKEDPSKIRFCMRRPDFEISPATQLSLSLSIYILHPSIHLNSLSLLLFYYLIFKILILKLGLQVYSFF